MEIRRTEKKQECSHEWNLISQVEVGEGFGFLFYCKYCLDFQVRGLKQEEQQNE